MTEKEEYPDEQESVPPEVHERILVPFIEATTVAFREWANTEIVVRSVYRARQPRPFGELAATINLQSPTVKLLMLRFPKPTAEALARRILPEEVVNVDQTLIQDCLAETANVIAGQTKALLHGTPHHFVFSTPKVFDEAGLESQPQPGEDSLIVACESDLGPFVLQVFVDL